MWFSFWKILKFWNFNELSFFLSYIECPNSRSERIDNLLSHSNYHHTHHHRVDSAQVESKVQLQRRSRTPKNEYKTLLRKKYAISKKRSLLFFVHSISLLLFFPALSLSLLFFFLLSLPPPPPLPLVTWICCRLRFFCGLGSLIST